MSCTSGFQDSKGLKKWGRNIFQICISQRALFEGQRKTTISHVVVPGGSEHTHSFSQQARRKTREGNWGSKPSAKGFKQSIPFKAGAPLLGIYTKKQACMGCMIPKQTVPPAFLSSWQMRPHLTMLRWFIKFGHAQPRSQIIIKMIYMLFFFFRCTHSR